MYYMVAIVIGMISHVILDILTPRGVKLFYTLPFNIVSPIHFKTGGLVDLSLATALSFGAIYVLFQPFVNELTHQWVSHFFFIYIKYGMKNIELLVHKERNHVRQKSIGKI